MTFGWNVPIEKVQKLKKYVRSLRLAFTVNNLATISEVIDTSARSLQSLAIAVTAHISIERSNSIEIDFRNGISPAMKDVVQSERKTVFEFIFKELQEVAPLLSEVHSNQSGPY